MFGKVRNAVETLKSTARALDPICIGGNEAAALFDAVSEGERVCGAMKALLARRIEETKVWRESGHRSAAHWVAEATGETVGAATRTLETARALEQLPATDAAFRAGQLSETQAAEIGDGGRRSRRRVRVVGDGGIDEPDGAARPMWEVRAGAEEDNKAWARRLHVQRKAHEWTDPDGAYHLMGR
jgi:Domain of unknown function (DUF222)